MPYLFACADCSAFGISSSFNSSATFSSAGPSCTFSAFASAWDPFAVCAARSWANFSPPAATDPASFPRECVMTSTAELAKDSATRAVEDNPSFPSASTLSFIKVATPAVSPRIRSAFSTAFSSAFSSSGVNGKSLTSWGRSGSDFEKRSPTLATCTFTSSAVTPACVAATSIVRFPSFITWPLESRVEWTASGIFTSSWGEFFRNVSRAPSIPEVARSSPDLMEVAAAPCPVTMAFFISAMAWSMASEVSFSDSPEVSPLPPSLVFSSASTSTMFSSSSFGSIVEKRRTGTARG
mmetsp:Transcript_123/g.260  ORF Transcript_123/g.260 Transcript_123/m.260 type:complete len:295 (-) Transcript_123:114-998(-)